MGAAFPRHPARAQPHEGNSERASSSLHGCFGITNRVPVHDRGTTLPSPNKVQNASDRNVRRNERSCRPPQYLQESDGATRIPGTRYMQAFAITLNGPTLAWFNRLPPSSISSLRELSIAFVSHFIGSRTYRKSSYHLLTIKQSPQKNLRSYVQRFNVESLKVDIPDEKFTITAFIVGLGVQSKDLIFSISKNP